MQVEHICSCLMRHLGKYTHSPVHGTLLLILLSVAKAWK